MMTPSNGDNMNETIGNIIFWAIVLWPVWGSIVAIGLLFYANWGRD
jgi:hypothetical protein